IDKGIALTPTICNLSASAPVRSTEQALACGTAASRRECFWRNSKPLGISWRKCQPKPAPLARARSILMLINFGGVCLKKLEPILRRTLIDRLRFAPAERSGAAEFPPYPPSAAPSLGLTKFCWRFNFITISKVWILISWIYLVSIWLSQSTQRNTPILLNACEKREWRLN